MVFYAYDYENDTIIVKNGFVIFSIISICTHIHIVWVLSSVVSCRFSNQRVKAKHSEILNHPPIMMYKQIHFRSTDRNSICTAVIVFLTQLKSSYGLNIQASSFVFAEDFQKPNGSLEAKMMTWYDELAIEKILLNSKDIPSWTAVAMMFSLFVVSPFLILPLIWFLQDLPLNKQCLLSYLYQDVLKSNLLFVWLWALSGMTFKILVENCMIDYIEKFFQGLQITR